MKQKIRLYLLTLVALLVLLFFLPTTISHRLRSGTTRLLAPVLHVSNNLTDWLHLRWSNLRNLSHLYDENAALQQRVIQLEQQVVTLANVNRENEVLRQELKITNRPAADETVAATLIGRTTNNLWGEAIIDQGENAQLQVGQAVVSQNVLVGRVKTVYKTTAVISLMNSTDAVVQALLTDSEALGLVTGGPTGLRLSEIDQKVTIREGETVQTSGLGGGVPRGLLIGQVDRVVSDSSAAKQSAIVRSPINFDQLRLVFIILKTPTP